MFENEFFPRIKLKDEIRAEERIPGKENLTEKRQHGEDQEAQKNAFGQVFILLNHFKTSYMRNALKTQAGYIKAAEVSYYRRIGVSFLSPTTVL